MNKYIGVSRHTWALATVLMADRGMVVCNGGFCDDAGVAVNHVESSALQTSRENWRLRTSANPQLPRRLNLPGPTFIVTPSTTPIQLHHIASWSAFQQSLKMTHQLPPMLLNLFAPRPPLRWVEPSDHAPEKRCTPKISGIGQYLQAMKEYKDNDGYVPTDSWLQKRDGKKLEKKEKQEKLLSEGIHQCTSQLVRIYLRTLTCFNNSLTLHRQAQRRSQSTGRRLQNTLRLSPCLRRHVRRSRARVRPLRSHRAHPHRRRHHCTTRCAAEEAQARLRIHRLRARKRHEGCL